jgi:hydroxymethylglutaryl-CoA reductase
MNKQTPTHFTKEAVEKLAQATKSLSDHNKKYLWEKVSEALSSTGLLNADEAMKILIDTDKKDQVGLNTVAIILDDEGCLIQAFSSKTPVQIMILSEPIVDTISENYNVIKLNGKKYVSRQYHSEVSENLSAELDTPPKTG